MLCSRKHVRRRYNGVVSAARLPRQPLSVRFCLSFLS